MLNIQIVKDYYMGRPKKFSKLSSDEIFQYVQLEYIEDFFAMDAQEVESFKSTILEEIKKWQLEFAMKGISYYCLRNHHDKIFKYLNTRFFYYENESGLYDVIVSTNLNDKKFRAEKIFDVELKDVIKFKNKLAKEDRDIKIARQNKKIS